MATQSKSLVKSTIQKFHPRPWRNDIQGLRGLAILLVVLYHAKLPVPGGFIGVDVFFVISGFVITASVRRRISNGTFSLHDFYWRRFRRLVPALSVVVLIVVLAAFILQSPIIDQAATGWMAISAMLSLSNVVAYLAPDGYFFQGLSPNPLLNTWSLSVEEQFYLGFSVIAVTFIYLARKSVRFHLRKALIAVLILGLISSFLLNLASSFRTPGTLPQIPAFINAEFAFFSPFTRVWEFGLGALLAGTGWVIKNKGIARLTVFAGLLLIIATALLLTKEVVFPGVVVVIPVLGAFLIILAGNGPTKSSPTVLDSRILINFGSLSYSWYLWHWPVIVFAVSLFGGSLWISVAAAFVSLIPSWLSLKFIEGPNLDIEWAALRNKAAPFLVWLVPPLIFGSLLVFLSNNLWFNSELRDLAFQSNPQLLSVNCTEAIADFDIGSEVCTWPSSREGAPVYLLGDSVAAQYANAVHSITENSNRQLTVATHPACPYMGVKLYVFNGNESSADVECQKANTEFTKILLEAPPGLVILSSSFVPFYSGEHAIGVNDQIPAATVTGKAGVLEVGLKELIHELEDYGHQVVVIQSTPEFFSREVTFSTEDHWRPNRCVGFSLRNVNEMCGTTRTIEHLDGYQSSSREAVLNAIESSKAQVVDPRDILCINGECPTNLGSSWIFRDGVHLSQNGVKLMLAELEKIIRGGRSDL